MNDLIQRAFGESEHPEGFATAGLRVLLARSSLRVNLAAMILRANLSAKILQAFRLLLAWPVIASAGELIPLSVERLATEAQLVLHGTVLRQSCQRDPEGRIYTKIELNVAEVWKGILTNQMFTIVHGGGVIGGRRSSASHQVEFATGEEVVAFLTLNRRGEGVCLGMSQGKFHVWLDASTKQKRVCNPFHGTSENAAAELATQSSKPIDSLSLAELRQRVRGGSQ